MKIGLSSRVILFLAVIFFAVEATAQSCKSKLKIGVVVALTAGPATSGQAIQRSILLADKKYDSGHCVQFIFEDDQFQPRKTVDAVNKLIKVDNVHGLIVYGTPTSLAVNGIAERTKVPMVALSILDTVVAGKQYVMKHWCTAERLNDAVVTETRKRGYKRVAIISTVNDAMLRLRDLFVVSNVVAIAANDEYQKDDFDFTTTATRYRKLEIDGIYLLLYPPQTAPFAKRIREAGIQVPLFGVHNIEDPGQVEAAQGAMRGIWFANADDGIGENYQADYRMHYNEATTLGGGSGFDVAKMFVEAAQSDLSVNDYLHLLRNFSGSYGVYSATERNDFDFMPVIKVITADGFENNARNPNE